MSKETFKYRFIESFSADLYKEGLEKGLAASGVSPEVHKQTVVKYEVDGLWVVYVEGEDG